MPSRDGTTPPAPVATVWIADDDRALGAILAAALAHNGFIAQLFVSGVDLLAAARAGDLPDLCLLDMMMPELDGVATCAALRALGIDVPVLFVSALDAPADKLRGLTEGGDDYITKPFDIDELVARLHIAVRRSAAGTVGADDELLRYADLTIDDAAHRVTRHGHRVELTSTEYRLLVYLVRNAGRVVSKRQILDAVWQYDFDGDASVVETYIYYLRRKIDSVEPKLIQTVRGAGYSLRLPDR